MSSYQAEERIKEMSKQAEILLRKKMEIQKKLKLHKSKSPVPIQDILPPKEEIGSSAMNYLFRNDGSFLEKFKKIADTTSGECSSTIGIKTENLDLEQSHCESSLLKLPLPKKLLLTKKEEKQEDSPCVEGTPEIFVKSEPVYTIVEPVKEKKVDACESEWFQDALKRAKDKAKEICNNTEVSLSAGSPGQSPPPATNLTDTKKRKSRWGETSKAAPTIPVVIPPAISQQTNFNMPDSIINMVGEGQHMEAIQGIMITRLTRNNPAIISYAGKVFGTLDLTDAQWKQCEEQMKMNIVFQLLQDKKQEAERLEMRGKVKYEYDSDEEVDGGTWEHKRRKQEMQETADRAVELTKGAEGKHHIGDFLPPEELANFIEKYTALKEGRDPDLSDYRENRLTEDNIGYRMLKSMGWTEGMGLGAEGKGITAPLSQKGKAENQGLGVSIPHHLSVDDDEYDAYRKRMMLAYKFRPNPLNNPRRAYY